MTQLREHAATTGGEQSELAEQTRLRRRRSARIRRTRRLIVVAVGLVLITTWLLQLKNTDTYRARVTRDEVGVHWVLDSVSSGGHTARAPQTPQYWLELSGGGHAATNGPGGCSVTSSTWSATRDGFTFVGGDDNATECWTNGVAPVVDPLIVSAQQDLLSGASVKTQTLGSRLVISYSSYTLTYHQAG